MKYCREFLVVTRGEYEHEKKADYCPFSASNQLSQPLWLGSRRKVGTKRREVQAVVSAGETNRRWLEQETGKHKKANIPYALT